MTTTQRELLKRFAWLCDELRAGNQFSDETLWQWAQQARAEIKDGPSLNEPPIEYAPLGPA